MKKHVKALKWNVSVSPEWGGGGCTVNIDWAEAGDPPCWLSAPLHPPNPPLFVFLSQSDAYHCHSAGAHQHRYADSEIISSVCLSVAYISRYHTPVFIDHPRICFLILTFDFAHSPEVNLWMGQIQIKLKNKNSDNIESETETHFTQSNNSCQTDLNMRLGV